MRVATSVHQEPICGDEVELTATAHLQPCIGVASFCRLHWIRTSLRSTFPFAVPFSNTPFFHLPDCIIAAGVRDFIMAEYDTLWH